MLLLHDNISSYVAKQIVKKLIEYKRKVSSPSSYFPNHFRLSYYLFKMNLNNILDFK
jgi:hypothetical protein